MKYTYFQGIRENYYKSSYGYIVLLTAPGGERALIVCERCHVTLRGYLRTTTFNKNWQQHSINIITIFICENY